MAVRDFKSDSDGNWVSEDGDFAVVADAAAVPQGIRIRVSMFRGECYLDESLGVEYIDRILVKNPDELVVRAELSSAIARTPDVTNVVGAQLVGPDASREASISYAADTIYSEEPITGQIGVP